MELRAELLHRLQHVAVALHPADAVGPGGPLHRKAVIAGLQRRDGSADGIRPTGIAQLLKQAGLPHGLNGWVIGGLEA